MSQIRTSDVTNFIKDMIDMTMIFTTDEAGYVIYKKSGDRVTINENGKQSPLIVYQEVINDNTALIINPLAEGSQNAAESTIWFFDTQKTALLGRVFTLIEVIMRTALDEKKATGDKDTHLSMEILNIASKIIEAIDPNTLKEFSHITDSNKEVINEFMTIYYQRKQLRSVLRCGLFDQVVPDVPTWKSKFPSSKVRAKTWLVIDTIVMSILNVKDKDDLSKFIGKADEISCAKLSSFLNVLLAVYREINPLLDIINPDIAIDLSKFAFHLNRLTAYADNAKFMIQPSRTHVAPATQQTLIPGVAPQVPMATPVYASIPGPSQMPGVTLVPGPAFADGRASVPTPVMPAGNYVPGYMPNAMPPNQGGYGMPPQNFGYQQPNYVNPQNNIPFNGPYVQQPYMTGGNNNLNFAPPGMPPGFNPNFR